MFVGGDGLYNGIDGTGVVVVGRDGDRSLDNDFAFAPDFHFFGGSNPVTRDVPGIGPVPIPARGRRPIDLRVPQTQLGRVVLLPNGRLEGNY